ncbi:Signal peptidase I [Streptomyces sp. DvalAA-14]|uniref:S26 family signal peptidase n=1 Tax=unclassified Streptomyces TaxID=2593676 RepID=UPI00081B6F42|nr:MULTISPECIES: S26 family signal peptidase [unclassified Streptomyces]SCD54485.1 Signal peptidase I [Streptomyces sp. DvalAA-14]
MALMLLAAGLLLLLGYGAARALLLVVNVTGRSMLPTLRPGRRLVVLRTPPGRPRAGAVVVFRLPRTEPVAETVPPKPLLIKRVAARGGDPVPAAVLRTVGARPGDRVPEGSLVLLGDNGDTTVAGGDSRAWGYVPQGALVGVVVGCAGRGPRRRPGTTARI